MNFNLTLIGQTIAMIVFVWFCMSYIWPPVMAAIEKRRKEIADGIAAGEKGQKELAEARHGSEAILAEARQKATAIADMAHKRSGELVAEAKQVAITEGERLIASARDRARDLGDQGARCAAARGRGAGRDRRHPGARPRGGRQGARGAARRAGRGTRQAGPANG